MKREAVQKRSLPAEANRLVVTQSNDLAGSIQDMNLAEKRLVLLAAAVIRQADTELPSVRFDVSDYRRVYNVVNNNLVSELLDLVSTITTRNIILPHGKNSRTSFSVVNTFTVVSGPDSETGRAYAVIELHRDMARFFLGLDGNFFSMPLLVYSTYRSNYALRMGEILASGNRGARHYTVSFTTEDLKARLDCKHYTNFAQFRRRVLEPAKKENDEIGYITFDWDEHKVGRKVERLTFNVSLRRDVWAAEQQRTDVSRIAFENKLRTLGFDQIPSEYYQVLGIEKLQQLTDEVVAYIIERKSTSAPVRNAGAYLRTRLQGEIERAKKNELPELTVGPEKADELRRLRSSQERFRLADELMIQLSQARNDHALDLLAELGREEQEHLEEQMLQDILSPSPTLIGPHQRPTDSNHVPEVTRRMALIRLLERRNLVHYRDHLATPEAFASNKGLLKDLHETDRMGVIQAAAEIDAS
jgi:plasmid replication initiation protein